MSMFFSDSQLLKKSLTETILFKIKRCLRIRSMRRSVVFDNEFDGGTEEQSNKTA